MRYSVELNERQFADIIASLTCAEAMEIETIELWPDNKEMKQRAADSQMRLIKLRACLEHVKAEAIA